MSGFLETAERLWKGDVSIVDAHPVDFAGGFRPLEELEAGVAAIQVVSNVYVFDTGDGLVLVDSGSPFSAQHVFDEVRRWSSAPVRRVIYSHGHIDHVFGVDAFDEEAEREGWAPPEVIGHENLPRRFWRYIMTAGYNGHINLRQFGIVGLEPQWPTEYRFPDETFADMHLLDVGDIEFQLTHDRGETDDHTWTWLPEQRILCTGDLFIWAVPNAGNPAKAQRYAAEWADALRDMAELRPRLLLPGHGYPVVGEERVKEVLEDTAALLQSLNDQTLELMNRGERLNTILHAVEVPPELRTQPYLQPVYDDPEFIVRNIWRLYGGWFDGNPASLKPAADHVLAREMADMAGGVRALAERALAAVGRGELRVAGHLAEFAVNADPDDPAALEAHAAVNEARRDAEPSTMAKGVFGTAAAQSRSRL